MVDDILRNLEWLGHDSFLLRAGGRHIYLDPFRLPDGLPPADLICITHEHFDHCSPEDVAKIRQDSTVVITEAHAAAKLGCPCTVLAPGGRIEAGGVLVEAVPAYNTNKQFHPQANHWLGFVLTVEGVRLYLAGDTDRIPEMRDIRAEIALLPVSGTYVMTAEEAVQAALDINPDVAIPMHFASIVGTVDDGKRFAAGLAGRIRVELLAVAA